MPHHEKEKFKTMHNVFDEFTNRTIFKLISEGHFDGLESAISLGKEANIFSAMKGDTRVMVKIYRLEQCDFNRMYDYIKEDPRYISLHGKKRKIIFAWVQREYRNLLKAREAGVNVPLPITFKNNVLVLEFIGSGDDIAPPLRFLKPQKPEDFFEGILNNMKKMHKAGLVHADLSPFNILNFNETPVFIDFSQCLPIQTSRAEEFLKRDIHNIVTFFTKLGMEIKEENILERIKLKN
ncbi:MAG TPA: serine protein kinase RIO [Candidatus Nanoarchaeia archaeon]|nr:serine protein kinase RIO [Candidatus Nanoarchaeia archaeon]